LFAFVVSFFSEGTRHLILIGIGDVGFKGTVENRSMAGWSNKTVFISIQNPASFANLR
jgi:hypothetical protein